MNCHGCDGRGWVDSKVIGPTLCPICKGNGEKETEIKELSYDQDSIWINLRRDTHENLDQIIKRECDKIKGSENEIVVHLLFDRDVTPQGNIIFHHLLHQTITGGRVKELSRDEIIARNYCPDEDGKIRTWDGVPVSPAIWDLIDNIDSDKRVNTCKIDMNRKGNPLFCDENMLAFSMFVNKKDDAYSIFKDVVNLFDKRHQIEVKNFSIHLLS